MYFNLIMNAVDATSGRKAGVINVSTTIEGDRVALRVRDDGVGMTADKIQQILSDRPTLDGEIHSIGFVFVRQTVADFGGDLSIESTIGKGTTMTIRLPYLPGKTAADLDPSRQERYRLPPRFRSFPAEGESLEPSPGAVNHRRRSAGPHRDKRGTGGAVTGLGRQRPAAAVWQTHLRGLPQVPGSVPRQHLCHRRHRGRPDRNVHGQVLRARLEHLARGPLAHALPGDPSRAHRGRRAEEAHHDPQPPQNIRDYFEFKEVPEADRGPERFTRMVRDECIRIARKLIATGLDPQTPLHLASAASSSPLPRSSTGPSRFRSSCWRAKRYPWNSIAVDDDICSRRARSDVILLRMIHV